MIDALITGADGFIGRALLHRLRREDSLQVMGLTRRNGDIADAKTWDQLPPARVVYHLAGRSFIPHSWIDSAGFISANVIGTERALEYCRRQSAALVLASAYVYGIPDRLPIREDDPARPNNPYALSKLIAEQLCEFAAQHRGVAATVLRLFNVYGPGQREPFLIPKIITQVRKSIAVKVLSLVPRRDYVFLDDVVEAMVAVRHTSSGFHRLNIGSGTSYSVADIISAVQAAAGVSLPVICEDANRPEEIPESLADISRAREILGWWPRWTLEEGLRCILSGSNS